MDFFNTNILSIIAFWPLAGMLVLLLIPEGINDVDEVVGERRCGQRVCRISSAVVRVQLRR